jgi:tetratricopeptide (TPR) repeat protein
MQSGIELWERYNRTGNLGDLEQAIALWREALQLTPATSPEQVNRLNNLGVVLYSRYERLGNLADLEEAICVFRQATQLLPSSSPELVEPFSNLSLALLGRFRRNGNVRDRQESGGFAWQAVQFTPLAVSAGGSTNLQNLSLVWLARYEYSHRLEDLDRAIEVLQRAWQSTPSNYPKRSTRLLNLGNAYLYRFKDTGNLTDVKQALAYLQQAVELTPDSSPGKANYLSNLGNGYFERYRHTQKAIDLQDPDLQTAFRLWRQACELGRKQSLEGTLATSLTWSSIATATGNWHEAVDACAYGLEAIDRLFEIQLTRSQRETWLAESQRIPGRAAYALAKSDDLPAAVVALERGRSRLLLEALERSRADLERLVDRGQADLYRRYRAAADRIQYLESLTLRPQEPPANLDLPVELRLAHSELATTIQSIQRVPGYEDFSRPPDFDHLRQVLVPDGKCVAVYLNLVPYAGLALVLHPGGIQPVWLELAIIENDLTTLLRDYHSVQVNKARFTQKLGSLLMFLGAKIMRLVAEAIRAVLPPTEPGSYHVTLIPTGRLASLPLHAAVYPLQDHAWTFLDDYIVTYAPSARVLAYSQQALATLDRHTPALFAVGNPQPLPGGWPSLDFSQLEIEVIAALFGDRAGALFTEQADLGSVEQGLESAEYLHLSCHGQFNAQKPLESGVILSGGQVLRLKDLIARPPLSQARLAVLSACQTAFTDFNTLPEEVVGLPAGFLQTGVPGVIGSLWMVNELSTALLMARFYSYHRVGDPDGGEGPMAPPAALRKA